MFASSMQTQVMLQLSGAMDLSVNTDGRERSYRTQPGNLSLTSAHLPDFEMAWRNLSPEAYPPAGTLPRRRAARANRRRRGRSGRRPARTPRRQRPARPAAASSRASHRAGTRGSRVAKRTLRRHRSPDAGRTTGAPPRHGAATGARFPSGGFATPNPAAAGRLRAHPPPGRDHAGGALKRGRFEPVPFCARVPAHHGAKSQRLCHRPAPGPRRASLAAHPADRRATWPAKWATKTHAISAGCSGGSLVAHRRAGRMTAWGEEAGCFTPAQSRIGPKADRIAHAGKAAGARIYR